MEWLRTLEHKLWIVRTSRVDKVTKGFMNELAPLNAIRHPFVCILDDISQFNANVQAL